MFELMSHDDMDFLSEIVFVYSWCLFITILMTNCLYLYLYLMTNSTSVWSMEYKKNEWMNEYNNRLLVKH